MGRTGAAGQRDADASDLPFQGVPISAGLIIKIDFKPHV